MFVFGNMPGGTGVFSFFRILVPIGRGARCLVLSTCLLPCTKARGVWLDATLTQETLFLRLENAFRDFGGVPRRLATRTIRPLGRPAADDECPWSRSYLRFCAHFGCAPVAIPCGAPQDTHLPEQVEDLVRGSAWQRLEDVQQMLKERIGAGPCREATSLLPLPDRPFVRNKELFRRVAADGFVTIGGDTYSVPISYAGQSVWVQRSTDRIVIRSQEGTLLATHLPGDGSGSVRLEPRHFEPHGIVWTVTCRGSHSPSRHASHTTPLSWKG
jgi:hypothetical protein